jgi:hypothetical protein
MPFSLPRDRPATVYLPSRIWFSKFNRETFFENRGFHSGCCRNYIWCITVIIVPTILQQLRDIVNVFCQWAGLLFGSHSVFRSPFCDNLHQYFVLGIFVRRFFPNETQSVIKIQQVTNAEQFFKNIGADIHLGLISQSLKLGRVHRTLSTQSSAYSRNFKTLKWVLKRCEMQTISIVVGSLWAIARMANPPFLCLKTPVSPRSDLELTEWEISNFHLGTSCKLGEFKTVEGVRDIICHVHHSWDRT